MAHSKHKILALSSSRVGDSGYLETALPLISNLLGKEKLKIAFIPFAMANNDYEGYTNNVKEGLSSLPHFIETVWPEKAEAIINDADVIMVGGGNTFKLLATLQQLKLISVIKDKLNNGIPFIGWSAGSNILSPGIYTTNDMPVVEPESFKALDIFSFQINPHYNNELPTGHRGETRDQRLEEFLLLNPGKKVVGIPEGAAILKEDGNTTLQGTLSAFLFSNESGKVTKTKVIPGRELNF